MRSFRDLPENLAIYLQAKIQIERTYRSASSAMCDNTVEMFSHFQMETKLVKFIFIYKITFSVSICH